MIKYKSLLFDLDGTITDSSEGIINSIIYALEKMDVTIKDKEILKKFVGPPLMDSYKGIFENKLFEGMEQLLYELYKDGYELVLATSKPDIYANQILEHFNIKKFFTHISACPMDESNTTKLDIIMAALEMTSVKNKDEILMIGDTSFDVNGAKICGIDSVGVLYGTDGEEELKHATYLAKGVEELRNILL